MTAWIDFLRNWSKKHNKSFACAMSDPDCKKMYHATKAKKGKDLVKERRNEEAEKMGMAAEDHPAPAKAKPVKARPAPVRKNKPQTFPDGTRVFPNFTKEQLKENAKESKALSIRLLKDLFHKAPEGEAENLMKKSVPALVAIAESIGAKLDRKDKFGLSMNILDKKGYRQDSPAAIRKREEAIQRNKETEHQYAYLRDAMKKRK